MTTRTFGSRLAAALILATLPLTLQGQKKATAPKPAQPPAKVEATVYLSPTCGCCSKWTDHMQEAGFVVKREVTAQLDSVPARQRVPETVRSCHTAVIGKYLVEGHVPADVVRQLLRDQP